MGATNRIQQRQATTVRDTTRVRVVCKFCNQHTHDSQSERDIAVAHCRLINIRISQDSPSISTHSATPALSRNYVKQDSGNVVRDEGEESPLHQQCRESLERITGEMSARVWGENTYVENNLDLGKSR